MKRLIVLTCMVGVLAPAMMHGSDYNVSLQRKQRALDELKARNPDKRLSAAQQRSQAELDRRRQAQGRTSRSALEIEGRVQNRTPRSAAEMDALERAYAGASPVDYGAFKNQDFAAYEKLPERTWYDYLTQKEGGFRTDVSRLGEQGKAQFARIPSYMGSMRDYVWSGAKDLKDDFKNKEYDRYFGKQRVRDYTRAYYPRTPSAPLSRADEYEKAYSEENQPRYGNRAWELEQAYNVPYAERIRSRMPNMPNVNVGQYMPDRETPARMWSKVPSAPDLGISRRASELYQGLPSGKSVGSYFTRKPAMAPMPSAADIEVERFE